MVDWSAANQPKQGSDSIWLSHGRWLPSGGLDSGSTWNPASRTEAMDLVERIAGTCVLGGRRILVGFDFAFSYPTGLKTTVPGIFPAGAQWRAIWSSLAGAIKDDLCGQTNKSNRFVVANELNRATRTRLFWGKPEGARYQGLAYLPMDLQHLPPGLQPNPLSQLRYTDAVIGRGIKSVWQLFGRASVGSQTLVGIPRLERLRQSFGEAIAVWPFDTGLVTCPSQLPRPVTVAEIWPYAFEVVLSPGTVKDEAQVRTVVRQCASVDKSGELPTWLNPPSLHGVPQAVLHQVLDDEGWILGVA